MKLRSLVVFAVAICLFSAISCSGDTRLAIDKNGVPVVERYGQLQVKNGTLCNQEGKQVQLRGMSSHGVQWHGKYCNEAVIQWLRDDWNSQVWRCALYLSSGGYIGMPSLKQRMIDSVDAAIKQGVYVLIDWHVLAEKSPMAYKEQALEFFDEMSKTYGQYPNVIYEICNEPNSDDVTWSGVIKPYAEEVIACIRKNDPDNIIIVGTPRWSQCVDLAADDPITDFDNIMYTLHFYAGSHGQDLRDKAKYAIDKGLAVFVTEFGVTKDSGDGGVFEAETLEWLSFLQKNNISWVNWSVNNKGEDSGVLVFNADRNAKGNWQEKDLSPAGKFMRKILRNETKLK